MKLEFPLLWDAVSALKPGEVYLEIGTGPAGCSAIMAAHAAQDGVEVHTVDSGEFCCQKFEYGVEDYRKVVEGWFDKYEVKDKIHFHVEDSIEMEWEGPIHVLFIDGAHDYVSVKADIEKWTPFIVPGGFVLFHDCATHKGVKRAVDETLRADPKWIEIEVGGSICRFTTTSS
jgi:predicted O-methyltransferase YrrM